MLVRGRAVPDAWPGGLPPALWRWEAGNISKEVFEGMRRHPQLQVGSASHMQCRHPIPQRLPWHVLLHPGMCPQQPDHALHPQGCAHCNQLQFFKIWEGRVYRLQVRCLAAPVGCSMRAPQQPAARSALHAGRQAAVLTWWAC
jgi:hypothetical protein